jgi:hypothetical protein
VDKLLDALKFGECDHRLVLTLKKFAAAKELPSVEAVLEQMVVECGKRRA